MRRCTLYVLLTVLITVYSGAFLMCFAEEEPEKKAIEDLEFDATTGYHHYTVKGNRGKVGEYEVLDSGFDASFYAKGRTGNTYFDITGEILDEDDQTYSLNIDANRSFRSELLYKRFRHFLDADPLLNQDSAYNYNPDRSNGITVEEIKASNTFRVPSLPFLKFNADYRSYNKRGHRQATTISKCGQCHVSSKSRRVNTSTNDMTVGVEAKGGTATVSYQHMWRSFNEDGTAPRINYGPGASTFLARGFESYSRVPDSKLRVNKLKIRTFLPFTSHLYASYQWGEKTNRDTHHTIDFRNIAARLSKYFSRFVSCDVFYSRYTSDSDVPDGIDSERERGGIDFNVHLLKKTNLKLTYMWEDIERSNFAEGSTYKERYRISFNRRITRKLRFHGKYERTRTDDPFVRVDSTYSNIIQTSLPRNEDELFLSVNWHVRHNLSLNTSLLFSKGQNSHYDVDENRFELTLSLWYAPTERFSLLASYSMIDTEIDSDAVFKTYHDRDIKSLLIYDEIPYDDRCQSWFLSASYLISPKVSLTGDITYIVSNADFDTNLDNQNIGEFSDLDISRIETSFGITYLYSKTISLYATYMYREYDDHEQEYLEGQFSYLGFGINYSF